jgi:hypothetical protein
MGTLNPDLGATNKYCENLRRLVHIYSEISVIAVILNTFEGRAEDWFTTHSMLVDKMRIVEGWIECLREEFKVNTAVARVKASKRKYTIDDEDVMKYFYAKLELLRTANKQVDEQTLVDEIWLGLSAEFRVSLNYNDIKDIKLADFGHVLRDKDLNFREA